MPYMHKNAYFIVQYNQKELLFVGYNNLYSDILIKTTQVLENLIPKSIDKKIFMSYNVDIILFYSRNEYLVNNMNKYAERKFSALHKKKEPQKLTLLSIYQQNAVYKK